MNFDELYALYGVQTEWNKVLSDREIFAEEPLDINEKVVSQESTYTFSEWEKLTTETTKIDDISFQSWLHIQKEETVINEVIYPSQKENQSQTVHQDTFLDTFEYPIQTSSEKEEVLGDSNNENILENQNMFTEPFIDNNSDWVSEHEEIVTDSWTETFSGSENNEFRAAIEKQAGTSIKRPKINVIASQSEETPLETLMGVKNESSNEANNDTYYTQWTNIVDSSYHPNSESKHHIVMNPFKWAKVFSEIKIFIVLFFTVFSTFFFFTNAKLVMITVNDIMGNSWDWTVSLITGEHNVADPISHKQEKLADLEESFQNIQKYKREEQDIALNMQDFLNQQQEAHLLNFNTLPPNNRLIVPDLGINVPLIDIPSMWEEDFENGNFDEELMHGVVKYPTTAAPWSQWNSLIFWHSSSEWWKHNEYWFIFRNLPRLQPGQKIQVIWNGQLTTYEMVERKVVNPKEVGNYYHEFVRDWEYYLTLMGCYPIWSSSQRMMVVAKKVTNE